MSVEKIEQIEKLTNPFEKDRIKLVVFHTTDWDASPEEIDLDHLKNRGWQNGLGYNFIIEKNGDLWYNPARWTNLARGAHCASRGVIKIFRTLMGRIVDPNFESIGISLIGKGDKSKATKEQLEKLRELLSWINSTYNIDSNSYYGHCYFEPKKTCPGIVLAPQLTSLFGVNCQIGEDK